MPLEVNVIGDYGRIVPPAQTLRPWARHLAWLPVPLIALAAAALYAVDTSAVHESTILLAALSAIFRTSTSLLVAYLAARTYLVAGSRAVRALGCGALTFGIASLAAGLMTADPNATVTVHNLGVCLAGACFLLSAVWALRGRPAASTARALHAVALPYLAVSATMGLLLWGALAGTLPDFLTAQGFTALRQGVLGLALVEFALASLCSVVLYGRSRTPFVKWYGIGLALIGMGVLVIVVEGSPGTALSWVGRLSQFLGGLYMLVGVITVAEGRWGWAIPLERALHESERRSSLIFGKAVSAMALARPDGTLVEVNEQWVRTFGYSKEEARGKTSAQLGINRDVEGRERLRDAILHQKSAYGVEVALYTRSGERRIFLNNLDVVDLDGEPYLLSSVQDITERKHAEAERERLLAAERCARQEAEAALRAREEFLSIAAHELKTPITSLRGYAELTLKRMQTGRIGDPQEIRRAFETIDRQADRLSILASQLLDLTGLEAGELTLRRQETDLVPLVRSLVETMQSTTTRHTLSLQAPPSLSAEVDPERLRLVLYNLLDNAIKYSPQGGPVEVDLTAPDPQTVRIAVRDHGAGIPPERRAQLFTRFFKAGAERPAGGLGLGLYIGRQLVALHGGALTAEFPQDGGSRFVVDLPREGGDTPPLHDQGAGGGEGPRAPSLES